MRRNFSRPHSVGRILTILVFSFLSVAADSTVQTEQAVDGGWGWWVPLIVVLALAFAVFLWRRSTNNKAKPQFDYEARYRNNYNNHSYDIGGVDADRELEWLRKAKKAGTKARKINSAPQPLAPGVRPAVAAAERVGELALDTRLFQEKMRKLQYASLPINSFENLSPARLFEPLPYSEDQSLLNAIEQANEEFEEDETVRDLAVRILTAFRTRNSVESLTQIALYDLSSNLRSKAVSILTDFDHESVFEAILLACADPTREVRAAAARGLFRLNFDRADAWKRIIETNDEFRMIHAARAATEAGIVRKSFERLIHDDLKVAYEAFALVALLIRSGETLEVFEAIKTHKDERVRFALIHVLKVQGDHRTHRTLHTIQAEPSLPTEIAEKIRGVIKSSETVMS